MMRFASLAANKSALTVNWFLGSGSTLLLAFVGFS
jgi:hypothetical protein